MNQETIKEKLLELSTTSTDFTVILTGKSSKKVNGLYKPGTNEILLHNRNFVNDDQVLYTAIHEYAHHLRCEGGDYSARCHNIEFWALFNTLLDEAEVKGFYHRARSDSLQKKIDKAKQIQADILALERNLGLLLGEIYEESKDEAIRYEDIIQHDLQLSISTAKEMSLIGSLPLSSLENLSVDASRQLIKSRGNQIVIDAIKSRKSIAQIKKASRKEPEEHIDQLEKERQRIEKTIKTLQRRLKLVLQELGADSDENEFQIKRTG